MLNLLKIYIFCFYNFFSQNSYRCNTLSSKIDDAVNDQFNVASMLHVNIIVMNLVCDLTSTHHQRSLAHHIDSCTTLLLHVTHGLHFPLTIALITQLSSITHCTDYTAEFHPTRFISLGLPLSHRRVLSAFISLLVIATLRSPVF